LEISAPRCQFTKPRKPKIFWLSSGRLKRRNATSDLECTTEMAVNRDHHSNLINLGEAVDLEVTTTKELLDHLLDQCHLLDLFLRILVQPLGLLADHLRELLLLRESHLVRDTPLQATDPENSFINLKQA